MALSDPIADFLTRLRNAKEARHKHVDLRLNKLQLNMIKLLHGKGFIENFLVNDELKKVRVILKYVGGREPVIRGLKRVSSPGLRRYVSYKKIPRILGGMGMAVVSTPKGILDDETARSMKVGGELLCYVW